MAQLRVEALWAVYEEMACTLDDVLARRTRSVLRRAEATAAAAPGLAGLLAAAWGRTPEDVGRQADEFAAAARASMARAGIPAGSGGSSAAATEQARTS
jgi:glycerol-3-phosphate dehydrogenase